MTLFEYLTVLFSIVLSLAIVRLLGGLSAALDPALRYWPHAAFVVFSLLNAAMSWWNFWSFRHVEWNLGAFFLTLTVPASIYLQAAALVPNNVATVRSWKAHYDASRRTYFIALAAFLALSVIVSRILLGLRLTDPIRLVQVTAFILALAGAFSGSRRIHELLPWLFFALLLLVGSVFFLEPEGMLPERSR